MPTLNTPKLTYLEHLAEEALANLGQLKVLHVVQRSHGLLQSITRRGLSDHDGRAQLEPAAEEASLATTGLGRRGWAGEALVVQDLGLLNGYNLVPAELSVPQGTGPQSLGRGRPHQGPGPADRVAGGLPFGRGLRSARVGLGRRRLGQCLWPQTG